MRVISLSMLIKVTIAISRWWSSVPISISIGSSRIGRRTETGYVELLPSVHRENLLHLLVEFRSRFGAMTVDRYPFAKSKEGQLPLGILHRSPVVVAGGAAISLGCLFPGCSADPESGRRCPHVEESLRWQLRSASCYHSAITVVEPSTMTLRFPNTAGGRLASFWSSECEMLIDCLCSVHAAVASSEERRYSKGRGTSWCLT